MKRDRDDGLAEEQAHQDVVEPRGDHEVGRSELREQLVDGADRVIRDTLVDVRREALPQQGPEVVDDESVCISSPSRSLTSYSWSSNQPTNDSE